MKKFRSIKSRAMVAVSLALIVLVAFSTLISYIFYSDALDSYIKDASRDEARFQFFIIFTCSMILIAVVLIFITSALMDVCVVKPVTDMTRAISEISFDEDGMIRGEDDSKHSLKKLEINSGDEMEELYKTLKKFQLDTSEYLISMRDDSWEKEHDSMTMLANGVKFNKRKKEVYPYADSIYIACLNIINLHVVNDKISSEAGDGIISKVARELRRLNSENIHAYRLEEDHFLLVFCGYLEEEAISVLTKWVDRVGRLNRNSDEFECRLVWGGAYGEGLFDVDDVYKHADTELYCNTAVTKKNLKSEES
ncbi:MAG: GGDEF domain protein [Firmicutes bacterium ADurb.Bin354]|nr:MAG: GGDEF domain protein [Firmicutes bacterium ADurb.Bin354]